LQKHSIFKPAATATVQLDAVGGGFAISAVHLGVKADVPGIGKNDFDRIAKAAKEGCPVSKGLKASITMNAELQS